MKPAVQEKEGFEKPKNYLAGFEQALQGELIAFERVPPALLPGSGLVQKHFIRNNDG